MVSIEKYRQYNLTAKIVVTNEDKVMFKCGSKNVQN